MSSVKYPHVRVQVSGEDGNIFAIIGRTVAAMKRAKIPQEEIDAFVKAVQSTHHYHDAVGVVCDTVSVR